MIRKTIFSLLLASFCVIIPYTAYSQDDESKILFTSIGDDLKSGDAAVFSKWFAEDMEVDVLGNAGVCSRSQARQLMKNFYERYTPKSFSIVHTADPFHALLYRKHDCRRRTFPGDPVCQIPKRNPSPAANPDRKGLIYFCLMKICTGVPEKSKCDLILFSRKRL